MPATSVKRVSEKYPEVDSVWSFKAEEPPASQETVTIKPRDLRPVAGIVLGCLIVAGAWWGLRSLQATRIAAAPASVGTAQFTSLPDGATIVIDGVARGTTPVKLSLAAGQHTATITSGNVSRTLPLTVDAGAVVSQYIELAVQPEAAGGSLEVGSDPAGAEVRVDGTYRGVAPLVLKDVPVGPHKVTVSKGDTVVNRTVTVSRGMTASVVFTGASTATGGAGWLTLAAPVEMEVFEDNRLIGTSRSDRIMLPAGTHELSLTNAGLELADKRTVKIAAGKTANLTLAMPNGKLSVNAVPWAEVSIDGRPAGTTPMANLAVAVGAHEILWRHPQLGERRQTVTVKAQSPTRVGVDFSK